MNIELSLLAVMLKKGDFAPLIRGDITVDHFETDEGKVLYNFIRTYRGESGGAAQYPSLTIVRHRFKSTIELPEPDEGDNVENLTYDVRLAKYCSELRQAAAALDSIANSSDDPVAKTAPIIAQLRKQTEKQVRTKHFSLSNDLIEVVRDYKEGTIMPGGIPWPWELMNDATKGIRAQELLIIAGRPKSRKTFTALRVAMHALKHHHQRILIFTPEMTARMIFLRCIAHLCDLHYSEFKDGSMIDGEEARLFEAADTYGRIKEMDDDSYEYQLVDRIPNLGDLYPSLDIVQSTGRDTAWMQSQIELHKPTLVISDSFYRQRPASGRKNDADWKAATTLSREIKEIAMEMDVPIIATHQLNRGAEKSVGDLSSLSFADAFGQDADFVMRVVTGKVKGEDVSALLTLGDREASHEGIMIRNRPCYDYGQIGAITNKSQVIDLMRQEEAAETREETEKLREQIRQGGPRSVSKVGAQKGQFAGRSVRRATDITKSKFASQAEEASREMLENEG